jgi:predicted AlkP superfamily pyrophosphatase or phosphodiesterase
VHPAHVDSYRHGTGLFTERVTQGLYETDYWFGDIVKATIDAGIFEDTTFIITADHGQINIVRTLSPNVIFAENGLIDVDEEGKVRDYVAFAKSAGASTHVFLKNPEDKEAYDKVYNLLMDMYRQEVYGFGRVFTKEEVEKEYRLSGDFSFVIETDGYSSFTNEWLRPYIRPLDTSDYKSGRATHGYCPEKGPQPTMFGFGPGLKPGANIANARLVDEAPTFARILGLEMKDVDGVVLEEILN